MTDPVILSSFELGLSLHTAAPKIEAYYQFYDTNVVPSLTEYDESCQSWVYWSGKQFCTTTDLDATLRQGTDKRRYIDMQLNLIIESLRNCHSIMCTTHPQKQRRWFCTPTLRLTPSKSSTTFLRPWQIRGLYDIYFDTVRLQQHPRKVPSLFQDME